jgi:hypothetical protein
MLKDNVPEPPEPPLSDPPPLPPQPEISVMTAISTKNDLNLGIMGSPSLKKYGKKLPND